MSGRRAPDDDDSASESDDNNSKSAKLARGGDDDGAIVRFAGAPTDILALEFYRQVPNDEREHARLEAFFHGNSSS